MSIALPSFAYHRPATIPDAVALFADADDASYVSGGHTLLPAMKTGLAAPATLIDLRQIDALHGIEAGEDFVRIGGAETHARVAASADLRAAIPTLAQLVGSIGDVQVRNRGTIGGSVANNDPSADYAAAVLALNAIVETDRREVAADEFFDGLYSTCLEPGEIVTAVRFPVPAEASYAKFRNPASRYAMAAVFVARLAGGEIRVAVTGAGNDGVFRWGEAEQALATEFAPEALDNAALDIEGIAGDIHASPTYRANLVLVMARRALQNPGKTSVFK